MNVSYFGPANCRTFNVTLSQGQEVPPVPAGTPPASGYALINFIGDKVVYKLYVYNVTEVTLVSHIFVEHGFKPIPRTCRRVLRLCSEFEVRYNGYAAY
jgi:hypothetical protein